MDAENVGLDILNTNEWTKGGPSGCLMSLVKIGVSTVALAVAAVAAYTIAGPYIMDLWW